MRRRLLDGGDQLRRFGAEELAALGDAIPLQQAMRLLFDPSGVVAVNKPDDLKAGGHACRVQRTGAGFRVIGREADLVETRHGRIFEDIDEPPFRPPLASAKYALLERNPADQCQPGLANPIDEQSSQHGAQPPEPAGPEGRIIEERQPVPVEACC